MPDVPNVPGVPALSSFDPNSVILLLDDAASLLGVTLPSVWGIYCQGVPVIIPASIIGPSFAAALGTISNVASLIGFPNVVPLVASTVDFEFSGDSPISNYPQENGAFQSYNKVQLPSDIKVKIAVGNTASQRQALFTTVNALRTSFALCSIVTPEFVYSSYNCKHVDYRRNARSGVDLIVADLWFEQVVVLNASLFSSTQSPTNAATQSIGNVQPQAVGSKVINDNAAAGFF